MLMHGDDIIMTFTTLMNIFTLHGVGEFEDKGVWCLCKCNGVCVLKWTLGVFEQATTIHNVNESIELLTEHDKTTGPLNTTTLQHEVHNTWMLCVHACMRCMLAHVTQRGIQKSPMHN